MAKTLKEEEAPNPKSPNIYKYIGQENLEKIIMSDNAIFTKDSVVTQEDIDKYPDLSDYFKIGE